MTVFKPMLAPHEDPIGYPKFFEDLRYPLVCSPKYDGVRCIVKGGIPLSRTGKELPSKQIKELFDKFEHFDGELIVGEPTDFNVYNRTQSHVMSKSKPDADLRFYVFDYTHPDWLDAPFLERYGYMQEMADFAPAILVEQHYITNKKTLLEYEEEMLEAGFEGIMMKASNGHYKQGRGTYKQGLIYKLKRFRDDEGLILDFVQGKSNQNTKERDELGYAKRSTAKAGMVLTETLGKFIVLFDNMEIEVAPGAFTHAERTYIWKHKEAFRNRYLKFRHFAHGVKDMPRFPRAIGLRDIIDMGD